MKYALNSFWYNNRFVLCIVKSSVIAPYVNCAIDEVTSANGLFVFFRLKIKKKYLCTNTHTHTTTTRPKNIKKCREKNYVSSVKKNYIFNNNTANYTDAPRKIRDKLQAFGISGSFSIFVLWHVVDIHNLIVKKTTCRRKRKTQHTHTHRITISKIFFVYALLMLYLRCYISSGFPFSIVVSAHTICTR